jgi:hypothetical protein
MALFVSGVFSNCKVTSLNILGPTTELLLLHQLCQIYIKTVPLYGARQMDPQIFYEGAFVHVSDWHFWHASAGDFGVWILT